MFGLFFATWFLHSVGVLWEWRAVRGSTLVHSVAWSWIAGTAAAYAGVVFLTETASEERVSVWHRVAASLTLCPGLTILGAKRPHHWAWHVVVVSLAVILSLPALVRSMANEAAGSSMAEVLFWVVAGIVLLQFANFVLTRKALFACMLLLSQILFFAIQSDLLCERIDNWLGNRSGAGANHSLDWRIWIIFVANLCLAVSAILSAHVANFPRKSRHSLDRIWLDFRDLFGLMWGLRFQERVNLTVENSHFPLKLAWNGFAIPQGTNASTDTSYLNERPTVDISVFQDGVDSSARKVLLASMRGMLRRFVDKTWIERRLAAT